MGINEARHLFEKNELAAALGVLNKLIFEDSSDLSLLLLRARIFYKMQKWGDAMNDYNSVLEIDTVNLEAKSGLEMARNILGYFTPDLFNP